jgi:IS4 transposase
MKVPYIPPELLDIILQYDGRFKYKNGKFVNIIHKNDERYSIIKSITSKKMKITETIELYDSAFYFQFCFNTHKSVGLAYDYNFSYKDEFEICYCDWRNHNIKQIRTYL